MEEALRVAGRGTVGYHVSLDMDWIDPEDAPGVGTPVRGGATYREAHLAMEIIADHGRLLSFEIVEVNPVIDEITDGGAGGGAGLLGVWEEDTVGAARPLNGAACPSPHSLKEGGCGPAVIFQEVVHSI